MNTSNIILIGMPGVGKSTVGVVLAKRLGYRFVDSDLVIQEKYGKLLHELIDENGVAQYDMQPDEFGAQMKQLRRAGASLLGGCCGTDPEYIRCLCAALREIG